MYQHRDSSIEIRVSVLPGRSECAGSSLLKHSDFPEFEQSQHTSANTVKEGEEVFFPIIISQKGKPWAVLLLLSGPQISTNYYISCQC